MRHSMSCDILRVWPLSVEVLRAETDLVWLLPKLERPLLQRERRETGGQEVGSPVRRPNLSRGGRVDRELGNSSGLREGGQFCSMRNRNHCLTGHGGGKKGRGVRNESTFLFGQLGGWTAFSQTKVMGAILEMLHLCSLQVTETTEFSPKTHFSFFYSRRIFLVGHLPP